MADAPEPVALILASASPRRHALLKQVGIQFRVVIAAIDEDPLTGEAAGDYVLRVARDKALEVQARVDERLPVLGADTAVVMDGAILGKPADGAEAASMLQRLSGRTHEVYSAAVVALPDAPLLECLNITRVTFGELDPEWIREYCATGDPLDKAGAYGVQGRAAEKIVRIEGSFSGVMGLPLYETCELLRRAEVLF